MDITLTTLILIPLGLGLLGFVEPCTVGSHLIFLSVNKDRTGRDKTLSLASFVILRVLVMGGVGGAIVFAGQKLIGFQTGLWLIFGLIYLAIGAAFVLGHSGLIRRRISLTPSLWRSARNPVLLGAAFGLNIPACAAPILFGLLGLATTSGSVVAGFSMMAIFAFALSMPLIPISIKPNLTARLMRLADWMRPRRWLIGVVFVLLGVWSIYFGLYVDPADWSGL